jgi:hypothetical protein
VAIAYLITLGIGTPADIPHFVTLGLGVEAPVEVEPDRVDLTAAVRSSVRATAGLRTRVAASAGVTRIVRLQLER